MAGGLCLISYLGDYPDKSEHAGNTGAIGFGWGFVVMLALTAVVYWLALRVRLPQQRGRAHIAEAAAEAEIEEQRTRRRRRRRAARDRLAEPPRRLSPSITCSASTYEFYYGYRSSVPVVAG